MKGLVISQALLVLMIICTVLNASFVMGVRSELLSYAEKLEGEAEGRGNTLGELCEYWEGARTVLCLSVHFDEIDEVSGCIGRLCAAYRSEDGERFTLELETLRNALEGLSRLERFSIGTVL